MAVAGQTQGFVLSLETQRALRFWRGSRVEMDPALLPEGVRPINLSLGHPAFITPEHIRERAKRAIDEGHTHYERNLELKKAIAAKLDRENGVWIDDPADGIVMAPGAHAILYQLMKAYVVPGDEVIMGDPGSYYYSNTEVNGGTPVPVPLSRDRAFTLDPAEVARRITPRTKMLCITSPDAPTGTVWRRDDLEALARLARDHDLLVVSDELYEYINFGEVPHVSIASLPGMGERTITVNGFSKGWAMTGWRIGYAAGTPEIMAPVAAINNLNLISVNSISQWAALETLEGPQDFLAESVEVYRQRMQILMDLLAEIDGVEGRVPDGTYYCWTDVSRRVDSVKEFSRFAWAGFGLRVLPGSDFGPAGEGYLRLSCSPEPDDIREGVQRFTRALDEYPPNRP